MDTTPFTSPFDDAFRSTTYLVEFPTSEISLRIGKICEHLESFLETNQAFSWAIVTAVNPGGARLSQLENVIRQKDFECHLQTAGYLWYRSYNISDNNAWPVEPGAFVLGPSRAEARALGRRFGQLAVVAGERGGACELVYC